MAWTYRDLHRAHALVKLGEALDQFGAALCWMHWHDWELIRPNLIHDQAMATMDRAIAHAELASES